MAGFRLGPDAGNIRRNLAAGFQLAPEPPQFLIDTLDLACHILPRPLLLIERLPLLGQGVDFGLKRRFQHGELLLCVDAVGLQ